MRDDPCWTSRENSLELIELSGILKAQFLPHKDAIPQDPCKSFVLAFFNS